MKLKQFNVDDQKVITGLDIGSKTAKCIMGVAHDNSSFDILASSEVEHNGIHNQQIVNAKDVEQAIQKVCQEVEIISERQITDLWLSLSCPFQVCSSEGMSLITGGQVSRKHIQQSIATALAIPLPDHQEVVHVLPIDFRVDRKDRIYNPLGLSGLRLETSVLLVSCEASAIQDLKRCVSNAGRFVRGFVVQPFSSGLAVAATEDKNRGVCVIDINLYCSQVSIFKNGRCIYLSQVPQGSSDLTGRLVNQLRISPQLAEQLKNEYGIPFEDKNYLNEQASVSKEQYHECLIRSLEECFQPIKNELKGKGFLDLIQNGMILTGEGSSLKNLEEWGRYYFEKPVRRGKLIGLSDSFSKNLEYSTSLGLLYYANKDDWLDFKEQNKNNSLNLRYWLKDLIS